jgi:hypothetical protein
MRWTWEYTWSVIDYENVEALLRHWLIEPPVESYLASVLFGYKPPREATPGKPEAPSWLALSPEARAEHDRKVLEEYTRAFSPR